MQMAAIKSNDPKVLQPQSVPCAAVSAAVLSSRFCCHFLLLKSSKGQLRGDVSGKFSPGAKMATGNCFQFKNVPNPGTWPMRWWMRWFNCGAVTRPVSNQRLGVDPERLTRSHLFLILVGTSKHSGSCPKKRVIEQQQQQRGWDSNSGRGTLCWLKGIWIWRWISNQTYP